MAKQLNIRSDEAYVTAARIARRLNQTTTQVVVEALARYDRETFAVPVQADMTSEQKALADELLALAKAGREEGDRALTSDHSHLYDDAGMPR